jgi:hypothetical protein
MKKIDPISYLKAQPTRYGEAAVAEKPPTTIDMSMSAVINTGPRAMVKYR